MKTGKQVISVLHKSLISTETEYKWLTARVNRATLASVQSERGATMYPRVPLTHSFLTGVGCLGYQYNSTSYLCWVLRTMNH